ncbi:uncharacterized protein [Acropora muricata]|uniref:uncharacterized protein isoform X1 n=1 Tax=Acropora muricata TaxID=159855 RepID=UPI0034E5CA48
MKIFFLMIVTSIGVLAVFPDNSEDQLIWQLISRERVCFHANGRRPGTFEYRDNQAPTGRLLTALKLVYRSGNVTCDNNVAYRSRWGCYNHPRYVKHPLNVIITDKYDNIIYPDKKYIKNGGLWYFLPFVDALYSDELVFTSFTNPFYLSKGDTLKIWYGEDLRNWKAADNGGRVCVEAFAYLQ